MKRSAKPSIARVVSAGQAFAIVEAGIAEIVAGIARQRRSGRRRARSGAARAA